MRTTFIFLLKALRGLYSRFHAERMVFTKLSFLSLLIFIAASCGTQNKPSENLLEEDKYITLLVEMELLESYRLQAAVDSTRMDSLKQYVLEHYGTNEKQFRKSHKFYQRNVDEQQIRIDKAIEQLRKDRFSNADSLTANSP